jgi:hypothetical protein
VFRAGLGFTEAEKRAMWEKRWPGAPYPFQVFVGK